MHKLHDNFELYRFRLFLRRLSRRLGQFYSEPVPYKSVQAVCLKGKRGQELWQELGQELGQEVGHKLGHELGQELGQELRQARGMLRA